MVNKLKMKMMPKNDAPFHSKPKSGIVSRVRICISMLLAFATGNAFAYEVTEFDIGVQPDKGYTWAIAAASDGNIWLAERGGHRIEKITPSGVITEYKTKNTEDEKIAGGKSIALGPDGNLWLLEAKYVKRIQSNGEMTQYALPAFAGSLMFAGPDGNMWLTASGPAILKMNMQGVFTKLELQNFPRSQIVNMAVGLDGNVWYTALTGSGDRIGEITQTGKVIEYTEGITKDALVGSIALGADGNMWFTEDDICRIAKITPAGVVTEYENTTSVGRPGGLISGHDGKLWLADERGGRIVNVSLDGNAIGYRLLYRRRIGGTEFVEPGDINDGSPSDLTVDPHGNIWFVGPTMDWVGRLMINP